MRLELPNTDCLSRIPAGVVDISVETLPRPAVVWLTGLLDIYEDVGRRGSWDGSRQAAHAPDFNAAVPTSKITSK